MKHTSLFKCLVPTLLFVLCSCANETSEFRITDRFAAAVNQYEDVGAGMTEGLVPVKKSGKWGFIDSRGKLIVPCKYDSLLSYSEGLAAIDSCGKWGFIDREGNSVIPCQYYRVESFSDSLAKVTFRKEGAKRGETKLLYGFIDRQGKLLARSVSDSDNDYYNGLLLVRDYYTRKYGYIDNKGELVIPYQFDIAFPFKAKYAIVLVRDYEYWKGLKYALIDRKGNLITHEWLTSLPLLGMTGDSTFTASLDDYGYKKWIIIKGMDLRIPIGQELDGFFTGDDRYVISRYNDKYGVIDCTSGRAILPCKYDRIYLSPDGDIATSYINNSIRLIDLKTSASLSFYDYSKIGCFIEGLAFAVRDDKYGFINEKGEEIIPCKYKAVGNFYDGFALVIDDNGKFGFINKSGSAVIPCIYDNNFSIDDLLVFAVLGEFGNAPIRFYNGFIGGLCRVTKDGRPGFVDKEGNSTFDFQ